MPSDKQPGRAPKNAPEIAAVVIVGGFFLAMLLLAMADDFSIYQLSIPLFLISWALLLVIHEFGHALMARAVGWRVEMVSIGTGPLIHTRSVWGILTEFRAIPLSGFAIPRPTDLTLPRLKSCLIYAAGPGVELLLAASIFLAIGSDTFLTQRPEIWLIALQSFVVAAVMGALINLVPLSHASSHGKAWTDGLGMLLCWRLSDDYFRRAIADKPSE